MSVQSIAPAAEAEHHAAGRPSQTADQPHFAGADNLARAARRADAATARPGPRNDVAMATAEPHAAPKAGRLPIQATTPPAAAPSRRSEDDETDAVLARLRQTLKPQPRSAPTRLADAAPTPPRDVEAPPAAASPAVGRLRAARSDLASGRVEAARQQLQQAQLYLVFHTAGGDPGVEAGAANVGRALSALGQTDIRAGQSFIDHALGALTHAGPGSLPPPPQREARGGYAPAYPPR